MMITCRQTAGVSHENEISKTINVICLAEPKLISFQMSDALENVKKNHH